MKIGHLICCLRLSLLHCPADLSYCVIVLDVCELCEIISSACTVVLNMDASVSGPSHSSMTESGTKRKYEGKISFPFCYCISKGKPTFIKGTLFAV